MKLNRSEISKIVSGKILQNEPMSKHTTFRIGGKCDFYVEVKTVDELKQLIKLCTKKKIPYQTIGFGSNILVKDRGVKGMVIKLTGDLSSLNFKLQKKSALAGGGCALQLFVKKCADNGLSGVESLVGIPGTVGGAVIMNAGTKEGYIGSLIKSVTVMNEKGEMKKIGKKSLKFSYRSSNIPPKNIIISAEFLLKKKSKNDIIKNLNNLMHHRVKTQPLGFYNAGCIFKNPAGDYAARFIDEAGLKGASVGGAVVSKLHANFINNTGTATAEDVLKLIKKIQKKVKEKFNKNLELEIKVIG
ncbi:MAG: UDP-N-acetylenolpyruvoylglucosamine reductase [Elusimicrobia bacterium HGW-Elusimicrobia-4]|nr:MAG: UDP-N-acetylenolpyruvoylglucosamine reductase [Elusimicrobia bacterium HGW-Elusimicrobia-4]